MYMLHYLGILVVYTVVRMWCSIGIQCWHLYCLWCNQYHRLFLYYLHSMNQADRLCIRYHSGNSQHYMYTWLRQMYWLNFQDTPWNTQIRLGLLYQNHHNTTQRYMFYGLCHQNISQIGMIPNNMYKNQNLDPLCNS